MNDELTLRHISVQVGQAVKQSHIPRKDIFVTTKIFGSADATVEESYENLVRGVDKFGLEDGVDLFLIHAPSCGPKGMFPTRQIHHSAG